MRILSYIVAIGCVFYVLTAIPHNNSTLKTFLIMYTAISCIAYALIRTIHSDLDDHKSFHIKWNILILVIFSMAGWFYWESGIKPSMERSVESIFWDQKQTIKALSSPDVDIKKNKTIIWTYEFYPDVSAATLFLSDVASNFKEQYNKSDNYVLSIPWHKLELHQDDLNILETTIERMVSYRKDRAGGKKLNELDYVSIKQVK